jgi:tetrahydromethanopterin S-methyltransferase subunit E
MNGESIITKESGMEKSIDKIIKISYHRNGVTGVPFYVILFESLKQKMVAIVHEEDGYVSILDVELLNAGIIEFGMNSWRCEHFEPELRKAIHEYEESI